MKKKGCAFLISILFWGTILLGIGAFVTGELQFITTIRIGSESRGYLGRRARILDTEKHVSDILDELRTLEPYKNQAVFIENLLINESRITAIIQDPNNASYYDYYIYNGHQLFNPRWIKGEPYKNLHNDTELMNLNDIKAVGIYKFHTQIKDYIAETDFEIEKDTLISINVNRNEGQIQLTSSLSGLRDDRYFTADVNGDNFNMVNLPY